MSSLLERSQHGSRKTNKKRVIRPSRRSLNSKRAVNGIQDIGSGSFKATFLPYSLLAALRMETLPLKLTGADFIPHPRRGDVFVCLETPIPLALSNNAIEPLPDCLWISPDNRKVLEGHGLPWDRFICPFAS